MSHLKQIYRKATIVISFSFWMSVIDSLHTSQLRRLHLASFSLCTVCKKYIVSERGQTCSYRNVWKTWTNIALRELNDGPSSMRVFKTKQIILQHLSAMSTKHRRQRWVLLFFLLPITLQTRLIITLILLLLHSYFVCVAKQQLS